MSFELKSVDINSFEDVFADMVKQFPESELKSYDTYYDLLNTDSYFLFVAYDKGIKVGYSMFSMDRINKTIWLDYLAVDKKFHSRGYGKKILTALKSYYKDLCGCYLEVEQPNEKEPDTIRRIKFYESLGAVKLNCEYYYPNKDGNLPMDVYFIPYASDVPDCKTLTSVISNLFELLHKDLNHASEVLKKIKIK